jgi:hypothetical protein
MRIVFGRLAKIQSLQILQYRTAHGYGAVERFEEKAGEGLIEEAFFVRMYIVGDGYNPRMAIAFDDACEGAEGRTEERHPIAENDQVGPFAAVAETLDYPVERIDAVKGDIDIQV